MRKLEPGGLHGLNVGPPATKGFGQLCGVVEFRWHNLRGGQSTQFEKLEA